ncbi:MAG: 5'/3'-nucleotidase SurE [Pseudomonadota bacterium]
MTAFPIAYNNGRSPRILVTNDDGIEAEGLACLARVASALSDDVWICAPANEASGVGHAITLHRPLRIRHLEAQRYTVDGTPTDCVLLAINDLLSDRKPDLVLSGVNHGSNIGDDVTYSGTIGAAMEATLLGVPAVAVSLEINDQDPRWDTVEHHAPGVIAAMVNNPWPAATLYNLNFPDQRPDAVKPLRVVPHGTRKLGDDISHHRDPRGRSYTWIGPARRHAVESGQDTDVSAIHEGHMTVTPIALDLTNYTAMRGLEERLAQPAAEAAVL